MAERQLKLYAQTTAGGTRQTTTTINNVYPQATSATMRSFAQQLNALTTNTYQKTDLVETTNVDTETIKINRTITFNQTTAQITNGEATFTFSINPSFASSSIAEVIKNVSPYTKYPVTTDILTKQVTITTNEPGEYIIYLALIGTDEYNATTIRQIVTLTAS